ncbi:MAG: D-glycerate dehydrogenase [Dehalococcoidia bacterium]
MATQPRAYLALRIAEDALARIANECDVSRFEGKGLPSKAELIAALAGAEGLLGSAQLPVDADVLAAAPKLRVVSNFGVGFDNVDLAAATERGILVCNTPGVLSGAVADLTMALILSLARRLPESERFVREGRWGKGPGLELGSDLAGKTLGIIGLGRIGRAVATRARPFGMSVCFHDEVREPPDDASFCVYRELDDLLRESDFVSLHVNLTPETRAMVGARELALMRPEAYLINTARGPVVDQAALVEALEEGRIAGAALDVLEREPPAADEPILQLPNVIVLPHVGSATRETRRAMLDLAIDNLLAALRGERPPCVVNPEALERQR